MSQENRPTTLLLDLDGTLLDSQEAILVAHRLAFRELAGIDIDAVGYDTGELLAMRIPEAYEHFGRPDLIKQGIEAYNRHYRDEGRRHSTPYEGARETIAELTALGVPWGVVTNKGRARAEDDLRWLAGDAYDAMICLICAEDTPKRKPDPGPILEGLRAAGIGPEGVAYVGDGPHDMRAARAAGTIAIGAAYGHYGREALIEAGADRLIDSPRDLLDIVSTPAEAGTR